MQLPNAMNECKLYAEPSAILYIRTHFGLQDVVIVSPDAGGAKRYVGLFSLHNRNAS